MSPRLNGKFVSKEKYEAAMAAEKVEVTVTEETKTRKPREADPITAATAKARAAKRELERVTKLHAKRGELPSLEDAQAAYDSAAQELRDALGV